MTVCKSLQQIESSFEQKRQNGLGGTWPQKAGSLKMNTALEYSTRVVQEGGRRCKKSTLNDLVHLTPLRIPLMNPPRVGRVQSFFSSRRNWDSPVPKTPHPQPSMPTKLQ